MLFENVMGTYSTASAHRTAEGDYGAEYKNRRGWRTSNTWWYVFCINCRPWQQVFFHAFSSNLSCKKERENMNTKTDSPGFISVCVYEWERERGVGEQNVWWDQTHETVLRLSDRRLFCNFKLRSWTTMITCSRFLYYTSYLLSKGPYFWQARPKWKLKGTLISQAKGTLFASSPPSIFMWPKTTWEAQ